jgi:hypothetical protein
LSDSEERRGKQENESPASDCVEAAMKIIGLVLWGLAIGFVGDAPEKEPVYDGKPLSAWIKAFKEGKPEDRERAAQALGKHGPKAKDAGPARGHDMLLH